MKLSIFFFLIFYIFMGAHPVLVSGAYSLFQVPFVCCGCTLGWRRVGVHRRAQASDAPCACHSPPLVAAHSWDIKVPRFVLHPREEQKLVVWILNIEMQYIKNSSLPICLFLGGCYILLFFLKPCKFFQLYRNPFFYDNLPKSRWNFFNRCIF